jgi:hypothetical protein
MRPNLDPIAFCSSAKCRDGFAQLNQGLAPPQVSLLFPIRFQAGLKSGTIKGPSIIGIGDVRPSERGEFPFSPLSDGFN